MGNGKGIGIGLGVVLLGLKLILLVGKASHRPSYETYAPAYPAYDRTNTELQRLADAIERERSKLISRQCATAPLGHLSFEIYWLNATTRRVGLAARDVELGAPWPKPVAIHGLDVGLRQKFGEEDVRACAENDRALIERALADATPPPPKPLGPGAWLVSTTHDDAGPTLLMPRLFDALKVKGELLAFAPSDNLVAYADSASPKAIALAAKAATDLLDRSGNSGCLTEDVLVLRKGSWVKWSGTAPELGPARAAAMECQVNQTSDLLVQLAAASMRTNASPDLALGGRTVAKGKAHVALTAQGEQLVALADDVVIQGESKAWPVSIAALQKQGALEPLLLDSVPLPGHFLFLGISEADLRKLAGVKLSARAAP